MKYIYISCLLIISLSSYSQVYRRAVESNKAITLKSSFFTVSVDSLQNQLDLLFNEDYPDFVKSYNRYFFKLEVAVNPYGCIDHIEYFPNTRSNDTLIVILKNFFKEYHPCNVVYYESELTGDPIPIEFFYFMIYFDPRGIKIGID